MVYYHWLLFISCNYGLVRRKLSGVLSFIISTRESFKRKIYQFIIRCSTEKRTGDIPVCHFCRAYCCFCCYYESNELSALNRPWFLKRSADSNSAEKYNSKKYLCIAEERDKE